MFEHQSDLKNYLEDGIYLPLGKPKVNLLSVKKLTLNFPFLIRRNIYYLLCVKYRLNQEGYISLFLSLDMT